MKKAISVFTLVMGCSQLAFGAQDYLEKIRPEKIRLQLKYVRERSFWTDIKIIFLTLQTIIFKQSIT